MNRFGRIALLGSAVCLGGCVSWYAHPDLLVEPMPAETQVRLCTHGNCRQVHAVTFSNDSVRAVPYFQATECDSCALHFVRGEIDSVQTRGLNTDATVFTLVITVPIAALLVYVSAKVPRD